MFRIVFIAVLLTTYCTGASTAAPSKEDCANLQASLLAISVDMRALQATFKNGTEQSWLGSFAGEERDAIAAVRDARLGVISALDEYIAAAQDGAVTLAACTR